jgi:hypothetical protein
MRRVVSIANEPLEIRPQKRRGSESNRRMGLLQSPALPLGYPAARNRYQYTLIGGVTTETWPAPARVPSLWSSASTMPSLKDTFSVPTGTLT